MSQQPARMRSVVHSHAVTEWMDSHPSNEHRVDEAVEGLEWVLARNPWIGKKLVAGENRVYVQAADPYAGTPEIWVVYSFDDNEVTLLKMLAVQVSFE